MRRLLLLSVNTTTIIVFFLVATAATATAATTGCDTIRRYESALFGARIECQKVVAGILLLAWFDVWIPTYQIICHYFTQ